MKLLIILLLFCNIAQANQLSDIEKSDQSPKLEFLPKTLKYFKDQKLLIQAKYEKTKGKSPALRSYTFHLKEFKVGDTVRIVKSSDWYGVQGDWNPIDTDGEIIEIKNYDLGIYVAWSNGETNSYNGRDLVLVGAEQKSYIDDNQLNQYSMKAIVVSSLEQIKELAKVSFLKDQIESEFPELFITHKVGNRYKHSDGTRYILTGENNHVALTNLKTGMIESSTVRVDNFNKITVDEFSELCEDYKELTLIKERH
jgi:hypothetical protein